MRPFSLLAVALTTLQGAFADCSHPFEPNFYEQNGYRIRRIEIISPFDFLFNVPGQNSRYAAIRLYARIVNTTRYSETALPYGLSFAGPGMSNLSYARHIGDFLHNSRFPAKTNVPWDVSLRVTAGGITGATNVLANDRFYGGSTTSSFVPMESWGIPSGPIVRSIPTNRLAS